MRLVREDGSVVCESCVVADKPLKRMKGLLGRSELPRGEGLLIRPTSSIHMWFMRFPIDVVFLDAEDRVITVAHSLAPWRLSFGGRRAVRALELPAGAARAAGVGEGERLLFE